MKITIVGTPFAFFHRFAMISLLSLLLSTSCLCSEQVQQQQGQFCDVYEVRREMIE
jgi:hypothetical protein